MSKTLKITVLVLVLLMSPVVVLAQDQAPNTEAETTQTDRAAQLQQAREQLRDRVDASRAEVREQLTDERKARIAERCDAAKTKIATHLARVTEFKDSNTAIYARSVARINTLIENLAATSVDTSMLQEHMQVMGQKVIQAGADFAVYESLLGTAASFDCTNTDTVEEFYTLIQDARDAHTVVKASIADAKAYMTDVIKVDLQAIREQLAEDGSEGEGA